MNAFPLSSLLSRVPENVSICPDHFNFTHILNEFRRIHRPLDAFFVHVEHNTPNGSDFIARLVWIKIFLSIMHEKRGGTDATMVLLSQFIDGTDVDLIDPPSEDVSIGGERIDVVTRWIYGLDGIIACNLNFMTRHRQKLSTDLMSEMKSILYLQLAA